jgi:hypothetical protein
LAGAATSSQTRDPGHSRESRRGCPACAPVPVTTHPVVRGTCSVYGRRPVAVAGPAPLIQRSRRAFSERRCLSAPARRCSRSSRGIRIAAPLPGPVNVTAASKAGTTRAPGARTHERGAEVVDHAAQRREYVPEPLDRSEEASVACLHGHLQPVRRAGLGRENDRPGYRHRTTVIGKRLGAAFLGGSLYELPLGEKDLAVSRRGRL